MVDPGVIGAGVGERVTGIEAALARQQSFVVAPGEPAVDERTADDMAAVAEHLVLRAMRTAADPVGHRVLTELREADVPLATLSRRLGSSSIVTWECVSDLVQCGLVGRSIEQDSIGLTAAGRELVELISATITAAARRASGAP